VAELSAAEIDALLSVNVTGAMIAAREAAARLSTARGGKGGGGKGGAIVNVSSLAAAHGAPRLYVHYAASKAALDAFTKGFALEVASEGIRVNAVRPGLIDTEIHGRAGMPDRVEKVGPRIPIGRAGTAEEVAHAILWLASDEASYVTGAILDVGGGA
jgi:NAD(P)-dependent dehydrogenase (short-subunit alcohol dehydrogenase family)